MICRLRLGSPYLSNANTARGGRRHQKYITNLEGRRCILSESGMIQYILFVRKNIQFADAAAAKNYLLNIRRTG